MEDRGAARITKGQLGGPRVFGVHGKVPGMTGAAGMTERCQERSLRSPRSGGNELLGGNRGAAAKNQGFRGRGVGSPGPGCAERRPRRGRTTGRHPRGGPGPQEEAEDITHVHRQLLVPPGARTTPAGATESPARGASAACVRHVGSQNRFCPASARAQVALARAPPSRRGDS